MVLVALSRGRQTLEDRHLWLDLVNLHCWQVAAQVEALELRKSGRKWHQATPPDLPPIFADQGD